MHIHIQIYQIGQVIKVMINLRVNNSLSKYIHNTKDTLVKNRGFTLVEVLLVISLLAISVGVTSDIVLTLIRSYVKTSVANDIEQNANFVTLKLENELKLATGVCEIQDNLIRFTTKDYTDCATSNHIRYRVANYGSPTPVQTVLRSVGGTELPLTDSNISTGVALRVCDATNPCFTQVAADPYVVRVDFVFRQASSSATNSFTGVVDYNNTVLLRGTY